MSEKVEYKKLALHEESENGEGIRDYGATEVSVRPENYIHTAIIALFICCPLGIGALINALAVNRKFRQGDVEGAQRASDLAEFHSRRAVVLGLIVWGTILIFIGSVALFAFLYGIGYYEYYSSYSPNV